MSAVTERELKAALTVLREVGNSIRELGSVPSGHLYARLMAPPTNLTLANYDKVIGILINSGLVQLKGHVLSWTGPEEGS